VIALSDLGFGPGSAVSGAGRGIGNVCDGALCPGGRRRFYLTTNAFNGANADSASNCARAAQRGWTHAAAAHPLHALPAPGV
jgi:hypothetical protein